MTRESLHDFNANVLRGVITPMKFDSIHSNQALKLFQKNEERNEIAQANLFTFRSEQRNSTLGSKRYTIQESGLTEIEQPITQDDTEEAKLVNSLDHSTNITGI